MKAKAIRTIFGGVLIHLSLGSLYTAANMITYIISYLHVLKGHAVRFKLIPLIFRILPITWLGGCTLLVLWARPVR